MAIPTPVSVNPDTTVSNSCNNWRCCWRCCWKSKCGRKRDVVVVKPEPDRRISYGSDDTTYSLERVASDILKGAHGGSEVTIDKIHIHVTSSGQKDGK